MGQPLDVLAAKRQHDIDAVQEFFASDTAFHTEICKHVDLPAAGDRIALNIRKLPLESFAALSPNLLVEMGTGMQIEELTGNKSMVVRRVGHVQDGYKKIYQDVIRKNLHHLGFEQEDANSDIDLQKPAFNTVDQEAVQQIAMTKQNLWRLYEVFLHHCKDNYVCAEWAEKEFHRLRKYLYTQALTDQLGRSQGKRTVSELDAVRRDHWNVIRPATSHLILKNEGPIEDHIQFGSVYIDAR